MVQGIPDENIFGPIRDHLMTTGAVYLYPVGINFVMKIENFCQTFKELGSERGCETSLC